VLVVHDTASRRFGVLGLSRRAELMYKPLTYSSLSELVRARALRPGGGLVLDQGGGLAWAG